MQSASTSPTVVAAPVRQPLTEVRNRMVRLHKEALGRGPTRCRALFPDPRSLVILLEDTFTVTERNLVVMGEVVRMREARMFAQWALEHEARAIVEDVLQRRTLAFVTALDPLRDMALHFFTLAPADAADAEAPSAAASALERSHQSARV